MSKVEKNPLERLWNTATKEVGRVAQEAQKHVTESINDIGKGIETGGFLGGAATALDKLSLGNIAVGALDSIIPGEDLPKPLAEGLSGVVNLVSGNPMGYVDIVQGFMALGGPSKKTAEQPGAPPQSGQRMQTPQSPSEAAASKDPSKWSPEEKKAAVEAAKERAKSEANEKAAKSKDILDRARDVAERGGGYAAITDILSGLGDASMFFGASIGDITKQGKANDAAKKKLADMEKQSAQATAELDKILNNPNLSFEDMIFLLMGALMKQSKNDVKALTKETRDAKSAFDATKAELNQKFDAKEAKVLDLEAKVRADPNDKKAAEQLGQAKSELRKASEERNDNFSEFNDSRQDQLEAIKNAMNKITEMQQTLSNMLNSMHQTAMSTIGNIR